MDPAAIVIDTENRLSEKERGEAFARVFSDFANEMSDAPKSAALDLLMREHRTIQQSMMKFCMGFIHRMSEQRSDLRNQASVELAKQIMDRTDYEARSLPLI
jgi:hypothetical protein